MFFIPFSRATAVAFTGRHVDIDYIHRESVLVFMNYRYGTTASGGGFYCFFCFHISWSRATGIKVKRNTFSPNVSLAYFFAAETKKQKKKVKFDAVCSALIIECERSGRSNITL